MTSQIFQIFFLINGKTKGSKKLQKHGSRDIIEE